jgi:DNA polymerase-3 subunit epsilon
MKHPDLIARNDVILFAREVLAKKEDYLIIDTETTGLGEKDVIIQFAAIDLDGKLLIDSLVKPKNRKSISKEASAIHGISQKHLQNAPYFGDVFYEMIPYLEAKRNLLVFNFDFDMRMIRQTFIADGLNYTGRIFGTCVMKEYAKFAGQWNPLYNDYRYQKLPGGDHTAVGDCLATLNLIKMLAAEELTPIPESYKSEVTTQISAKEHKDNIGQIIAVGCPAIVVLLILILSKC